MKCTAASLSPDEAIQGHASPRLGGGKNVRDFLYPTPFLKLHSGSPPPPRQGDARGSADASLVMAEGSGARGQ